MTKRLLPLVLCVLACSSEPTAVEPDEPDAPECVVPGIGLMPHPPAPGHTLPFCPEDPA